MALYSARVGGRDGVPLGVPPPRDGNSALGATPPPADGASNPSGLLNWHCLVSECSYSVRPSGSCVIFHFMASASCWVAEAVAAAAVVAAAVVDGRSVAELVVASLSRCWFSTYSVIIIIATDPVAQFTIGEPVQ